LEQVMEKVEPKEKNGETRYTATIDLTNSKKVGFTRRDLALCFFPRAVVEKADRNYEVITLDGTILPFDNPRVVRRLWNIVQQKYIYNGVVKKAQRHNFDWFKIVNKLKKDYKIQSINTLPERQTLVTQVKITPDTDDFNEYVDIMKRIIQKIAQNAPHLTFLWDPNKCFFTMACPREH